MRAAVSVYLCLAGGGICLVYVAHRRFNICTYAHIPVVVVALPAGERAVTRVDNVYTIFLRLPSS